MEQMPITFWIETLKIERPKESGQDVQCNMNMVVFSNNPEVSGYINQAK